MTIAGIDGVAALAAYCGPAPGPAQLWGQWNLDPWLLLGLGAAAWLWRVATPQATVPARRSFVAALAVLALVFVSPLCAATTALFSARVLHHVLLVAVAAPLLALALPALRGQGSPVGWPFVAATGLLYAWHAPPLYAAALADTTTYWLMQFSLLGSATVWWRAVLAPRTAPALALLGIGTAAGAMGLLGALLTFAPESLYAAHRIAPLAFGLTALDDQRLGGLIMWVPALLPYAVMGGLAIRRWPAAAAAPRT